MTDARVRLVSGLVIVAGGIGAVVYAIDHSDTSRFAKAPIAMCLRNVLGSTAASGLREMRREVRVSQGAGKRANTVSIVFPGDRDKARARAARLERAAGQTRPKGVVETRGPVVVWWRRPPSRNDRRLVDRCVG